MLFLPKAIFDARNSLWRSHNDGDLPAEQFFRELLELDPDDFIGLVGLGRLRREAGDTKAAEEYFWRAIRAHPCVSDASLLRATISTSSAIPNSGSTVGSNCSSALPGMRRTICATSSRHKSNCAHKRKAALARRRRGPFRKTSPMGPVAAIWTSTTENGRI